MLFFCIKNPFLWLMELFPPVCKRTPPCFVKGEAEDQCRSGSAMGKKLQLKRIDMNGIWKCLQYKLFGCFSRWVFQNVEKMGSALMEQRFSWTGLTIFWNFIASYELLSAKQAKAPALCCTSCKILLPASWCNSFNQPTRLINCIDWNNVISMWILVEF